MKDALPPIARRALGKVRRALTNPVDAKGAAGGARKGKKVCTVGASLKHRERLEKLNPGVVFEHRSFRDFLPPKDMPLPACEVLIFNPEYENQRLLQAARGVGVEVFSLFAVLNQPFDGVEAMVGGDVGLHDILGEPEGEPNVIAEVGGGFSEQLAYVEDQIKQGNRQADFLESFKSTVFESAKQSDTAAFFQLLRRYLNYRWEGEPFSEEMYDIYNRAFERAQSGGLYAPTNFYATFAAMLASSGQYDRLRDVMKKVPEKANISGYLGLRVALQDLGIIPTKDGKDRKLLNRLQENEGLFAKLVQEANGSVVIVGNGPQDVGKGRGPDVDAAGLVVRFNSFSTDYPHSMDYGTRTDVWVRMIPHPYVRFSPDPSGLKQVMITGANRLYRNYNNWDWFRININRLPGLSFSPSRPYIELAQQLGAVPTSGLLLCYMLYKLTGPVSREQVLGCSFVDPGSSNDETYHYSDAKSGWSSRHAIEREKAFFQTIAREDVQRTYYTPVVARARMAPSAGAAQSDSGNSWDVHSYVKGYSRICTTSTGLVGYNVGGKTIEEFKSSSMPGMVDEETNRTLVIGFGLRGSGQKALKLEDAPGVDVALAEYGLVSALSIPSKADFKFSLILDDLGIFFDTTRPSRTEQLILAGERNPEMLRRARALIDKIVSNNIVKYNDAPLLTVAEGAGKRRILVMDQTSGDLSISLGQCEKYSFEAMLEHALAQTDAHVFLKLHPETVQGVKAANYDLEGLKAHPRLTLLTENCNAMHLIKQMDEVYVMTSGAGLEALMAGKKVTCFGVPFYAGWGLTEDMQPFANPRAPRLLEEVISAVFLRQTLWFHPETREPCEVEQSLNALLQLR